MTNHCKDCAFYKSFGGWGECHFNAPFTTEKWYKDSSRTEDARGISIARNTEWTKVSDDDFCGQFKTKELP